MKMNNYAAIRQSLSTLFDNSNALIEIVEDDKEISKWQEEK